MLIRLTRPTQFRLVGIRKANADGTNRVTLSSEEADKVLRPIFQRLFNLQHDQVQLAALPISLKSHSPVYNDVGEILLPSRLIRCNDRVAPAFKDFKRRSAQGEILLSRFHDWTALISYKSGRVVTKTVPARTTNFPAYNYPVEGANVAGKYILVGDKRYEARIDVDYITEYYDDGVSPFALGWVDPPYDFFDTFTKRGIDGSKIQEVLADHNDKTVDALTSLAEMPETCKSIIAGLKLCLKMYIDARKKAFRLQNKVSEWKNAKTSDKNRRQVLRNIQELQTAIAEVWLNFRYNIQPNVYLIEDMLKAINAPESIFLRDRSRVVSKREFWAPPPNWESEFTIDVTERVMIKSRLVPTTTKFETQYSFNVAKTAWELIPLSFVIDWFVSVGDFISALSPTAYAEQGSTYSWKADDKIIYKHSSGSAVEIKFNGYDRIVIDPKQYCALYWEPDVNTVRQFDAIALTWKIFIERFFKKLS